MAEKWEPFQSTLPAWGETLTYTTLHVAMAFQSTLPAWGETYYNNYSALVGRISIHSPRMGRDRADTLGAGHDPHFNPLSPHGERPKLATFWGASRQFQSTLPAWGETISDGAYKHCEAISIHSPRMGRDVQDLRPRHVLLQISIHSPRMGRDDRPAKPGEPGGISIHSPRMGRDGHCRP